MGALDATTVQITVVEREPGSEALTTLVSTRAVVALAGLLVAMKLQAIENRPREKEGTDLQDIHRLLLDRTVRDERLGADRPVRPRHGP